LDALTVLADGNGIIVGSEFTPTAPFGSVAFVAPQQRGIAFVLSLAIKCQ